MTTSRLRQTGVFLLLLTFGAATLAAQVPKSSSSSSASRGQTRGGGSAKAVLPDPELLDGSKQKADKRSEYGMIGDFELPGDENERNAKVGGSQNQNQGQNGQQQGGGGGPQASAQGQEGGAQGAQAQSGEQPGGQQGGSENAVAAPDANAQAQGRQVAELSGDAQGQGGGESKPPQVSIGDAAMKIETQNVAGVVGTQQAGQTQQHEKGTGTGGKGPTGNNSNKGAERGRVMPAGL